MSSVPTGQKAENSSSSNKWWEQYYVRYFVGTVVGAAILLALAQYAALADEFRRTIPFKTVNGWGLAAVAAAGLAYCYIASAPILTLHAIRGGLGFHKPRGLILFSVFLLVLLGIPGAAIGLAVHFDKPSVFAWTLTLGMVAAQCVGILIAQRDRFEKINGFYEILIEARRAEREDQTDYRDSYGHMREHGNAKLIIILEILLGLVIATASDTLMLISIFVLWLAPAAYVWFIATVLESHFAHRRPPPVAASNAASVPPATS